MPNDRTATVPEGATHYEVTGEWMKACGKGDAATIFPIKRIRGRLPGGGIVIDVVDGDSTWTVIHPWRGRFVVRGLFCKDRGIRTRNYF